MSWKIIDGEGNTVEDGFETVGAAVDRSYELNLLTGNIVEEADE